MRLVYSEMHGVSVIKLKHIQWRENTTTLSFSSGALVADHPQSGTFRGRECLLRAVLSACADGGPPDIHSRMHEAYMYLACVYFVHKLGLLPSLGEEESERITNITSLYGK